MVPSIFLQLCLDHFYVHFLSPASRSYQQIVLQHWFELVHCSNHPTLVSTQYAHSTRMELTDRLTALWLARPFLQGFRRLVRWSSESRGKEESDEWDGETHVEG